MLMSSNTPWPGGGATGGHSVVENRFPTATPGMIGAVLISSSSTRQERPSSSRPRVRIRITPPYWPVPTSVHLAYDSPVPAPDVDPQILRMTAAASAHAY